MTPEISIILPVYNGEKYLAIAIESMLNQTFQNFEFIIINDGSTDNSLSIIKSYSDKRIIVIDQIQKGVALTLKNTIFNCNSNFIARMDQDDISNPTRLEFQYKYLINNPKISVISNAVNYIDKDNNYIGRSFPPTNEHAIEFALLNKGCVINHPSVMFRKDHYLNTTGYTDEVGDIFCDYYLWLSFLKKGYKIRNLMNVLLNYRIIGDSLTSNYLLSESNSIILTNLIKKNSFTSEEKYKIKLLFQNSKKSSNAENYIKRKSQSKNNINKIYFFLKFFFGDYLASSLITEAKNFIFYFKKHVK